MYFALRESLGLSTQCRPLTSERSEYVVTKEKGEVELQGKLNVLRDGTAMLKQKIKLLSAAQH